MPLDSQLNILIVDDEPLARARLRELLGDGPPQPAGCARYQCNGVHVVWSWCVGVCHRQKRNGQDILPKFWANIQSNTTFV